MPLTRFQDTEQINKDVDQLVQEIERLRFSYEQYFLGLERQEPTAKRKTVENLIKKWAGMPIQNPRTRFRYQQAVARTNSFRTYWDRVLREMAEGKYQRDVFRAKIHEQERQQTRAGVPGEPKSTSAASPKPGDPMQILFDQYLTARQKCGEATQGLSLDAFRKTMTAQVDALKKKPGITGVRFKVAVEDGKAKIKALPQLAKKPGSP